jgi:hypothetical protein
MNNNTAIAQNPLWDTRLSWKARGLHQYLLSLPNTDNISIAKLALQSEVDGQSIVSTALKELEDFGYVSKQYEKDHRGKFTKCAWRVYNSPQLKKLDSQKK